MIDAQHEIELGLTPKTKRYDRRPGVFYPTESFICQRRLYFRLTNTPAREGSKPPLGLFKMGVAAELAVIEALTVALEPRGYTIVSQQQARYKTGRIDIHGFADFVVTDPDGEQYVGEIKSTTSKAQLKSSTPQKYHYGQLQCYLGIFGIPQGCVLYVDRSDICKTNQIRRPFSQEDFDTIMGNFESVLDNINDGEAPDGYSKPVYECRYCEYNHRCSRSAQAKKSNKYASMFQTKLKELNGQ